MTLVDAYEAWTAAVQLPGTIDQTEATDILQGFAPDITPQQGDDWWVAVATRYDALGIIAQPTYVQLRNHANNNEAGANDLFESLIATINTLPETNPVQLSIANNADVVELAAIPGNITTIETHRDLQSDQVLIDALNAGIQKLELRQAELQGILGS